MTDEEHPALGFLRYQHAHTEVEAARHQRNAASGRLDLAQIKERAAELVSQREPLHGRIKPLLDGYGHGADETRKLINDAIHYVIVGRWPE